MGDFLKGWILVGQRMIWNHFKWAEALKKNPKISEKIILPASHITWHFWDLFSVLNLMNPIFKCSQPTNHWELKRQAWTLWNLLEMNYEIQCLIVWFSERMRKISKVKISFFKRIHSYSDPQYLCTFLQIDKFTTHRELVFSSEESKLTFKILSSDYKNWTF